MAEIKISELSIGDWVNQKMNDGAYQVQWLEREMVGLIKHTGTEEDGSIRLTAVPLSFIEPIPLTPEILEKNGFVDYEVGKGWYVLNVADDLRVWLHRNSHDWTFQLMKWSPLSTHEIGKVFIKHTHQLQHALRLAGVEREIEM